MRILSSENIPIKEIDDEQNHPNSTILIVVSRITTAKPVFYP